MAAAVEAARLALEENDRPLTGTMLKDGLEQISEFDAEGLMPPITITPEDHQGGGYGRVSQWNGERWEPVTDWNAAYQDVVWEEIEEGAAGFEEGR